jgi:hypothetical protein
MAAVGGRPDGGAAQPAEHSSGRRTHRAAADEREDVAAEEHLDDAQPARRKVALERLLERLAVVCAGAAGCARAAEAMAKEREERRRRGDCARRGGAGSRAAHAQMRNPLVVPAAKQPLSWLKDTLSSCDEQEEKEARGGRRR